MVKVYLHSNMVRFIIEYWDKLGLPEGGFTFQYG